MLGRNILEHYSSKELQLICDDFVVYKFDYISIAIVEEENLYSAFSDPRWKEVYINMNLHKHDPCLLSALKIQDRPLFWNILPTNTKKSCFRNAK